MRVIGKKPLTTRLRGLIIDYRASYFSGSICLYKVVYTCTAGKRKRCDAEKKRQYWPGLKIVIKALCMYLRLWGSKLPDDLPNDVKSLIALAELACQAMDIYDAARKRGQGV